jgi:hypothetical protein
MKIAFFSALVVLSFLSFSVKAQPIGTGDNNLVGDFSLSGYGITPYANYTKITTNSGYLELGPKNTGFSHFYTDRPLYYFNKPVVVDGGVVASYDEPLVFKTDKTETRMYINNSNGRVGIGTTSPNSMLHINAVNEAGLRVTLNHQGDWGYGIKVNANQDYTKALVVSGKDGNEKFMVYGNGKVAIGNHVHVPYNAMLTVDGKIHAEEINVSVIDWPDYVFGREYKLKPLSEVERFINENNHLPGVPSAVDVENEGVDVGQMNKILLEKVEELTLYMIEIKKENEQLKTQIQNLNK